jgi:serine/threonine protein kinase
MARGLGYFHKHDILHLDIKSPNILLGSSGAKIADVGLGRKVKEGEAVHSEPAQEHRLSHADKRSCHTANK